MDFSRLGPKSPLWIDMTPPPPFEKEFFVRLRRTFPPQMWLRKNEFLSGGITEVVG